MPTDISMLKELFGDHWKAVALLLWLTWQQWTIRQLRKESDDTVRKLSVLESCFAELDKEVASLTGEVAASIKITLNQMDLVLKGLISKGSP